MRGSPAIPIVEQAEAALREGKPKEALQLAEDALTKHSDYGPAFMMRGIAHAQLGEPEKATSDLRRAVKLSPNDYRAHLNLSAHLFYQDEKEEAARYAREALGLDRGNEEAIDILRKCGDKRFSVEQMEAQKASKSESEEKVRVKLPLPKGWDTAGYVILALSVFCFISWTIRNPLSPDMSSKVMSVRVQKDALGFVQVMLLPVTALFQFSWTFLDILDRGKRFVWLLPLAISPVLGASHCIPFALYLFVARRASNPS